MTKAGHPQEKGREKKCGGVPFIANATLPFSLFSSPVQHVCSKGGRGTPLHKLVGKVEKGGDYKWKVLFLPGPLSFLPLLLPFNR